MDDNQRYSLLPLTLRKQVNCNLTDIVISSMERVYQSGVLVTNATEEEIWANHLSLAQGAKKRLYIKVHS